MSNPGYLAGRIAKGTATGAKPATLKRLGDALQGLVSGSISVGSRRPTSAPVWVTLEVAHGGFATGRQAAALKRTDAPNDIGNDGLARMHRLVQNGNYHVDVPENSILPVLAWLLGEGREDDARELLAEVQPFLGHLKMYPEETPEPPLLNTDGVHLYTVGDVRDALSDRADRAVNGTGRRFSQRRAQSEALNIYLPLYAEAIHLFAATRDPSGWPLQTGVSQDWLVRVGDLWSRIDAARKLTLDHPAFDRVDPVAKRSDRGRVFEMVSLCAAKGTQALTGRQVGLLKVIVAGYERSHGLPGSADHALYVDRLQRLKSRMDGEEHLIGILISRLRRKMRHDGLVAPETVCGPVEIDEIPDSARGFVSAGMAIPESLTAKVGTCLHAPLQTLFDRQVIRSGEQLASVSAQVIEQLMAQQQNQMVAPAVSRLYWATYAAMRRRRGLLLLNLKHQVRIDELPWVRALRMPPADPEVARAAVIQFGMAGVTLAPADILPNKMVSALADIVRGSKLEGLEFVEELAADIFMGRVSRKFGRIAQRVAPSLVGSLYSRFYGLERVLEEIMEADDAPAAAAALVSLGAAYRNAAWGESRGFSVGGQGAVIEAIQIFTTHNLATLFGEAGDQAPDCEALARRCARELATRLPSAGGDGVPYKSRIQIVKQSAYCLRQMVYFLSQLPLERARFFVEEELEVELGTDQRVHKALASSLKALRAAVAEEPIAREHRVLLGWAASGSHWVVPLLR